MGPRRSATKINVLRDFGEGTCSIRSSHDSWKIQSDLSPFAAQIHGEFTGVPEQLRLGRDSHTALDIRHEVSQAERARIGLRSNRRPPLRHAQFTRPLPSADRHRHLGQRLAVLPARGDCSGSSFRGCGFADFPGTSVRGGQISAVDPAGSRRFRAADCRVHAADNTGAGSAHRADVLPEARAVYAFSTRATSSALEWTPSFA